MRVADLSGRIAPVLTRIGARRGGARRSSVEAAAGSPAPLAEIPLLDIGAGGGVDLLERRPDLARAVIARGRRDFGGPTIDLLDALSRRWAARLVSPYRDELFAVAARLPRGAFFMNLSYNWGCTAGVADDPAGAGVRLLRTLDWPFNGIGTNVVVARQSGPAGVFYNVTWPGYIGAITAMAPGRFAAAINQAPIRRRGPWPWPLDWAINRRLAYRSRCVPPDHELRAVFEQCPDYAAARARLIESPPSLPALYSLVGCRPGEACVIERLEERVFVHDGPEAVANKWLTPGLAGKPRGAANDERRRDMLLLSALSISDFDWLRPPLLNRFTRLAVIANPARGDLAVQGCEVDGPATRPFHLRPAA